MLLSNTRSHFKTEMIKDQASCTGQFLNTLFDVLNHFICTSIAWSSGNLNSETYLTVHLPLFSLRHACVQGRADKLFWMILPFSTSAISSGQTNWSVASHFETHSTKDLLSNFILGRMVFYLMYFVFEKSVKC